MLTVMPYSSSLKKVSNYEAVWSIYDEEVTFDHPSRLRCCQKSYCLAIITTETITVHYRGPPTETSGAIRGGVNDL